MTRLAAGLTLLTLAGSLVACSSGVALAPTPTPPDGLAGRTFLSVAITDAGVARPLVSGTRIRLDVRATDFSASAGCNTMGGQYQIVGGDLVVDQLATTDMGCPAPLGTQDSWLAQLLASQPTFTLDGDDLTLSSGSTVVHFQDRRVADPDRPLVGPLWTVDSIISGDAVSSVPNGATATLAFAIDGTLTVFTGCNQGGASWTQTAGTIVIRDLVLTKITCTGAGGPLEAALVGVLHAGTFAFTIDADALTLQAGSNGIQLRAT